MRISPFLTVMTVGCIVVSMAGTSRAQFAGGAQGFGGAQGGGAHAGAAGQGLMGPGIPTFSPVTGAAPMGGGMNAQQQMAQIYMLYGMLGGMGRGNVSRGVSNPFVGGYGMGGLPSLDTSTPSNYSPSGSYGTSDRKAELRAQRAEQKKLAKLAKAKPPAAKAASKTSRKKNAPQQQ